ncbi:eukaryotic mitochondrial regulator protein-domain-containing protein [Multifurca ochricompacta]|uniref:Eukaryotic mitochondrial regulator protein-domain-containing protein n=1 Tax=Multifurca ochricompacta TaxID=376703 RepID=A0AAD4MDZ1_9AGAM|nr:eukaryotic mitochondrial regulator protein-domain-containing protein [Multifurca ochricompacta]
MLVHRRLLPRRLYPFSSTSRATSSSSRESQGKEQRDGDWSAPNDPTWGVWKKTIGKQFDKPHRPCNWLGGKVPFPLNPSFKPPTPVSDALRNTLFRSFMANPKTNSVRNLASRYHLSIKRVDAILRLKGLEDTWVKVCISTLLTGNQGKPLQTGFLKGMEQILGVTYDTSKHKTHEDWVESRIQTVEADALDQAEGDDQARTRYQRMFWEPVVEGQNTVLPNALKRAREDAKRHGQSEDSSQSIDATLRYSHDGKEGSEVTNTSGATINRPVIKFIDVGTKFLDPKDHTRRMKESERRAKVRSKKAPRRHLVV